MPNITPITRFVAGLLLLLSLPITGLLAQQLDPAFHAPVLLNATNSVAVSKVVRQPDGRYLISGGFQSVDGHLTRGLARLLPDGHVDTTFTYQSAVGGPILAVQADGKLLIYSYNSTPPYGYNLLRVLPSGQLDTAFRPALQLSGRFDQVLVQPDGKLLISGVVTDSLGRSVLVRLLPNGRVDASFMASFPLPVGLFPRTSLLLEPTGRILFATSLFDIPSSGTTITRFLSNGRVDSTFAYSAPQSIQINKTALCPNGAYAIGGVMDGNASINTVGRLLPSGALDVAFAFSLFGVRISAGFNVNSAVDALAVLPDGRILASGNMSSNTTPNIFIDAPLLRSGPQGGIDATWNPNFIYTYYISTSGFVSNTARVNDLLIEPSGKLLVAGQFAQAGGVPHYGLARLLPATPLATRQAEKATSVFAWPVPAHDHLQVALTGDVSAQQITLLDATGRRMLAQQPTAPTTTLNTAALTPGLYMLQVRQADGTATTRKIVLE